MFHPCNNRYEKMNFPKAGKSGLRLSQISLGLWHNFGTDANYDNCIEMLTGAFNLGITHFDLANNYGPQPGSAEITCGRILKNELSKHRDELIISSKAGYLMWPGPYGEWGSRKYMLASLDQSLKRLQLDYLDIFYSHRYDPETPLEETMSALVHAVRSGKALYAGISNYPAHVIDEISDFMRAERVPLVLHQIRYHMLNRSVEDQIIPQSANSNLGVICFCPLAQGLLTDRYLNTVPSDSRAAGESIFLKKEQISTELVAGLQKLNNFAAERGQSLAQMALSWVLANRNVTSALIGASRLSQIAENCKALNNLHFSQDELNKIDLILNEIPFVR
ncbi:MAG: aldo/keto reductase [Lentisphaeria bacterium]